MIERKNYSFYMATDFTDKLAKVQAHDTNLKTLSRSQALYFIVSNMAKQISDDDDPEQDEETSDSVETEDQPEGSEEQQN